MSKTVQFKHCMLEKLIPTGCVRMWTWLPTKFATVGQSLKRQEGDNWDPGWIVKSTGTNTLREDQLPDPHRDIKGHRKSTGDSMPKQKAS